MSSYIERLADGRYEVGVACQDGIDRTSYDDEGSAIDAYQRGVALATGGFGGDPDDVPIPAIIERNTWPTVTLGQGRWSPQPSLVLPAGWEARDLFALAIREHRPEPGRRYVARVVLEEAAGPPPFVGAGI